MTAANRHARPFALIDTKLNRPLRTSDLVLRPRLFERLNDGLLRRLTLVSAPAGYGKTTLLLSWLDHCEWQYAWLSLDEYDNFFPLFCSYVLAAIRTCFAQACPATEQLLQVQQIASPEEVANSLVSELAAIDKPFVFVFDDYHFIHDVDIQHFMRALVRLKPHHLHIVLATRADPSLSLPRLRANNELTEIRSRDLRFSVAEAATFFERSVGERVDEAVVSGINQSTEGWTAGLRLAAIYLQSGRSGSALLEDFKSGGSDFVTDYMMSEVLEQQSKDMQRFLLYSSILDRFCASLCDAVFVADFDDENATRNMRPQTASAAGYLDRIKRANLFLVPLDTEQNWFRYHRQFADILRYRLQTSVGSEYVAVLHRRASQWFSEHGFLEEAIEHALVGDGTDRAVQIVEGQCRNLLNPIDRIALERWISLLPDDTIWNSPRILIARGWILFRQWNLSALDALLERIESLLDSQSSELDERSFIEGQVAALHSATLYARHHDYTSAAESGEAGLPTVVGSERDARGLALAIRSASLHALGHRDIAVHQLLESIETFSPDGPSKTQSYLALALLHRMEGDLAQMQQIVERMLPVSEFSASVNAEAVANYLAGLLYYERNDLVAAETHFSRMLALRHRSNVLGGVTSGLGLVRIRQLQGRYAEAQAFIDMLRSEILKIENYYMLPLVEAAQAHHSLLEGDRAAALHWTRTARPDVLQEGVFHFEVPALVRARILLRYGTSREMQYLKEEMQRQLVLLETHHFTNLVIQWLAVSASVNHQLGYADDALAQLRCALELGQPGGFVRAFLDSGESNVILLQRLHADGFLPEYTARLLSAAVGQSSQASPETPRYPQTEIADSGLIEPLTRRETEIMQLLGRGASNQEIAEKLVISPHTVKTHATSIYAKLGVSGRARAVHKARQLGILSDEP